MKIVIAGATDEEVRVAREAFSLPDCDFLVTGVGMVAATYRLSKYLAENNPALAINIGLAGSFDRTLHLGDTVIVCEDRLSELGAEDGESFLRLREIGIPGEDTFRPTFSWRDHGLREVRSITVNTVHGNARSIDQVVERLQPDIESMEGAAFFFCCSMFRVPSLQLRAISNYVERRNRDAWDIPVALKSLSSQLTRLDGFLSRD